MLPDASFKKDAWFKKYGWFKKLEKVPVETPADRYERRFSPPVPLTFEQIYKSASVKPPRMAYGIQKVAEMANSPHLAGMSPEFKRKALLMALNAADTDEGEVLNDLVIRQRALKDYEDSYLDRVNQFEAGQLDQNRLQQAELDKITSQFRTRIQANLDEVAKRHKEFRDWQESKRQELHRFTDAANLSVPHENVEEEEAANNVTTMLRPTGTFR